MPSTDLLIPFFVASLIFAFVPGPGMLYAVAQTLARGRRAGWWSALGFHIAGVGHIAAAALGVTALLAVLPTLLIAMKLTGAAYLIWMGIGYVRSPSLSTPAVGREAATTTRKALRDSIVVEALNPKSALFFLVFLPQFTDSSADLPIWFQILLLGLVVNTLFTLSDAILIELSHALASSLSSSEHLLLILKRVGGAVLIGLGAKLALAEPR
ncbi:MAG: LysE family translocator [Geminicoccaceae bacterium]